MSESFSVSLWHYGTNDMIFVLKHTRRLYDERMWLKATAILSPPRIKRIYLVKKSRSSQVKNDICLLLSEIFLQGANIFGTIHI